VDGQNQHCNIVCNPLYTIYTTTPKKDRLSVLSIFARKCTTCFRQ